MAMPIGKRLELALAALRQVTLVAGNLPDSELMTATGPNDARHRGILVCNARDIAKSALDKIAANSPK